MSAQELSNNFAPVPRFFPKSKYCFLVRAFFLIPFLLYSPFLVGIGNIPSPLILFLEFEQPYIEYFDPTVFKTRKLRVQTILGKMICLHCIPSGIEWVLVLHDSQHPQEFSDSFQQFPGFSFLMTMFLVKCFTDRFIDGILRSFTLSFMHNLY